MNHVVRSPQVAPLNSQLVADMSLALLNRTGAYHVCREIVASCGDLLSETIYWRLRGTLPENHNVRRILARLMLAEIAHPAIRAVLPRRRRVGERFLYMDPLYVMGSAPQHDDIVLCHDMGPITHPDLFGSSTEASYAEAYALIRRGKPGMVFVSQASRDAFVRVYGNDYRFLEVIPLFVRSMAVSRDVVPPAGVTGPFLLTVGALERRKNYLRTLEAFERSGLAEQGWRYVFCGPRGNAAEEITERARRTHGVVQLGYVSDTELQWLYQNAAGFVLVSLLEGFGIPALEAAQLGLVSLVGDGGAQREAVGDGALHADPLSVEAITSGMQQLATLAPRERTSRVALAREHAARLSRAAFGDAWRRLLLSEGAQQLSR